MGAACIWVVNIVTYSSQEHMQAIPVFIQLCDATRAQVTCTLCILLCTTLLSRHCAWDYCHVYTLSINAWTIQAKDE